VARYQADKVAVWEGEYLSSVILSVLHTGYACYRTLEETLANARRMYDPMMGYGVSPLSPNLSSVAADNQAPPASLFVDDNPDAHR